MDPVSPEQVRAAPKVLLHDHLDGGLRPQTIIDLAPEGHVLPATEADALREWFEDSANSGSLERYLEDNTDESAKTPEEFWEQVADNARTSLKAQIILDKLAEDRTIGVEQTELTQMLFNRAQQNGTSQAGSEHGVPSSTASTTSTSEASARVRCGSAIE